MTTPLERNLRQYLVQNLDLIEQGLRPVQFNEFALPNAHGTRGSIDILARDQHGMWVIVELKRSRASSRQALHEVAKYAELLCREKNIATDRIRAVIVSTDWTELLVPVSNMSRDWSHDLRGYHLVLDCDGQPIAANRVELLERAFEHRITPIHIMYFFRSAEDRREAWVTLVSIAAEVGAVDLLAAEFDRVGRIDLVPNSFGLYIGFGRIDPGSASGEIARGYDEMASSESEYPLEYMALCHVCNRFSSWTARYRHIVETARAGQLSDIVNDENWEVRGYCGSGAFSEARILDDLDMCRILSGYDRGDGQILYSGTANPSMKTRWRNFLAETGRSLSGNPEWEVLVRRWLEDVSASGKDCDVFIQIYNPCDLISSLIHGWPDRLDEYLPRVVGIVTSESGDSRYVTGGLCWTDHTGTGLSEAVTETYGDFLQWQIYRSCGIVWEMDLELLSRLGLHYILLEQVGSEPAPSSANENRIWVFEDGAAVSYSQKDYPARYSELLKRISQRGELVTIGRYLSSQASVVDYIASLFRQGISFI